MEKSSEKLFKNSEKNTNRYKMSDDRNLVISDSYASGSSSKTVETNSQCAMVGWPDTKVGCQRLVNDDEGSNSSELSSENEEVDSALAMVGWPDTKVGYQRLINDDEDSSSSESLSENDSAPNSKVDGIRIDVVDDNWTPNMNDVNDQGLLTKSYMSQGFTHGWGHGIIWNRK